MSVPSPGFFVAARCMHLDRLAVELTDSLRDYGADSILLRGPSIVRHLYDVGETRGYADVDLLVAPESQEVADRVLIEHEFRLLDEIGRTAEDRPAWSRTWFRDRDGVYVDLHRTLVGAGVAAATTWSVLRQHVEGLEVSNQMLNGLDLDATAAIVALHAAQHGRGTRRTVKDLARALDRLSPDTWQAAAELAHDLAATAAFAAGLRLLPEGREVAKRLRLPDDITTEIALRASTAPPTALGFDWLAQKRGARAKTHFLLRKLVPPIDFMRAWSSLARNGTWMGLVVAYVWRPIWLMLHAGPGLRAWLQARRATRG
jgi:hypothetical protein